MTDPAQAGRPGWARRAPAGTPPAPAVLAVDGTGMLVRCSRAAQRAAKMEATDGTPTGALLMFISSLARKLRVMRPGYLVFAWDGPGSRDWRREVYPQYKEGRDGPGPGAELRMAMEFCGAASIRQLIVDGFEADDLLAAVQRHVAVSMPASRLALAADDVDLLQLVADEMTVVTGLAHDSLISFADVAGAWMAPPWWLPGIRALSGDPSDGIPGLHGIGPHRARQMLSQGGWQWPLPESVLPGKEDRAMVAAWRSIMELLDPPRRPEDKAGEAYFAIEGQAEWASPDNDAVRDFFQKYELSSLSRRIDKGGFW